MNTNKDFYDITKIFDDLFCDLPMVLRTIPNQTGNSIYHAPNFPPSNVFIQEDTKDLMFQIAVAGYDREDVNVEFEGDKMLLTLKENSSSLEGYSYLRKGIKTTKAEVTFPVPVSKYKTLEADAKLENGILTIKVPALEEIKPKKLLIN